MGQHNIVERYRLLTRKKVRSGTVHSLGMTLEEAEAQLDPQRFLRVNRQYIISAAVAKLSAWFLGKLRVHLKGYPHIVSKEKASSVKRWLDS